MSKIGFVSVVALTLPFTAAPALADDDLRARLDRLEREYVRLMVEDRRKTQELERLRAQIEGRAPTVAPDPHDHDHGSASHDGHGDEDDRAHAHHDDGHGHDHDGHAHSGLPEVLLSGGGVTLYAPSIAIDTALYRDDGDEPLEERLEGLRGFGHGHDHGHDHADDGHGHSVLEDGFNLRHAEVGLAAGVDGFGRGQILLNASEDGVELEEAYIQTERFAGVIDLRLGQFPSGYGFTNALHVPERPFADRELANQVLFGDHGLEGLGARVTAVAPDMPVELGLEVFNGDGEVLFSRVDDAGDVDEPSVVIGWVKGDVPLAPRHRLSLGLAGGFGAHQESHEHVHGEDEEHDHDDEAHEEDEDHAHEDGDDHDADEHDDDHDHDDEHAESDHDDVEEHEDEHDHDEEGVAEFLDGDAWFIAPSLAYHYDGGGEGGAGDIRVNAEYIYRVKDLDIVGGSENFEAEQDGVTVEAIYGVAPDLRVGARYEHIGLINSVTEAGIEEEFDDSWRVSGLVSYDVTPYARVGVQANYGEYDFEDGRDDVFQVLGRVTLQLGPHLH